MRRRPTALIVLLALAPLTPGCAWLSLQSRGAEAAASARPAGPTEPALRAELLTMAAADQAARAGGESPGMRALDARHTARLKDIVARWGWPGSALVGADGARAAWLLVQHADADPAFQQACLPMIEAAVARGEADARELAYLTDRVALATGRPQTYGTQFYEDDLGEMVPQPIADEATVDLRRQAVGLEPLAAYHALMNEGRPPKKTVTDPAYRAALQQLFKEAQAAKDAPAGDPARAERAQRIQALLRGRGWPTRASVGSEAVFSAAWLAAEAADDLALLREVTAKQEAAFTRGEGAGETLAYMVDQLRLREGLQQRYGTHFVWRGGVYGPSPIAEAAGVDARRKKLGLMPLAEWTALMRQMNPTPPVAGP